MKDYLRVGKIYDDTFLAKEDESLRVHTNNVLEKASELIHIYGHCFTDKEKTLLLLACEVHDYGKVNALFQQKIREHKKQINGEVYHNFLSPLFLDFGKLSCDFDKTDINNLVTAVFYHHTRDFKQAILNVEYFEKYLKENIKKCFHTDLTWQGYLGRVLFMYPNVSARSNFDWTGYAKLKGLLQKCDYAASAHVEVTEIYHRESREIFLQNIHEKIPTLRVFQKYLEENQDKNIVAVAPTGSGKTEGSFLWLGKEKGFYTLPLKVASNAIYKRARELYGYDEVSLLHSSALDILMEEGLEGRFEITKNLGYPLTITTVDQLFKFTFKALGHEILFATLTYAKVVIDEIQMYSSTILACLLVGLGYLVKQGGKFLITTATLPPLFLEYLDRFVGAENYEKPAPFLEVSAEKRHYILVVPDDFQYSLIVEQALNHKVLVICNTVKRAQEVYQILREQIENVYLLHSRFIKKDRFRLENDICNFDGIGIWVTTQVVEASLDIDFDILHTDMAHIDNLFQRMGRCYRKRNYEGDKPNVYIYDSKVGLRKKGSTKGIYDEDIYLSSLEELMKYSDSFLTEKIKYRIIQNIYNREALKGTTYLNDLDKKIYLLENSYPGEYSKMEADNLFRDITSYTVIPEPVYEENINLFQDLMQQYNQAKGLDKLKIKNKILDYSVAVPSYYKQFIDKNELLPGLSRARVLYDEKLGVVYEEYNNQF